MPLDGERHDVRSLSFALSATFVLRCASYAAGLIIPVSLGIKGRTDSDVTVFYTTLIGVSFYAAELLGAPVFGALSDRYGRKPFMLLGPIFGGVAIQMLGFSFAIPVLVLVRVWKASRLRARRRRRLATSPPRRPGRIGCGVASWASTRLRP